MAYRNCVQSTGTIPAGADLSTHQYKFIDVNSSGQGVLVSSAGAKSVGVLNNDPTSGQPCEISHSGIEKILLGATVAAGAAITSNASGVAITAATGNIVHGIAVDGGDSGEIGTIYLFPNSYRLP